MKKFWVILLILALVIATGSSAQAASGSAAPIYSTAPNVIQGQYIVVYKTTASTNMVDETATTVNALGGKLLFQYSSALHGYAAQLSQAAVAKIAQDPNVDYIEADQVITLDTTQSPATWGIDRIDQRALPLSNSYTYNYTGAGVTAYVIDTGIRITHTQFGGRASIGTDTVGDGQNGNDCNGHGTHVSGTIGGATYGVAKGVSLVAVRVLNCSGSGTVSGVIAGVDWVTSHHTANSVANMSLGGGVSTALDTAVSNSIAAGVTYTIAAGNSNRDACKFSPARVTTAITVGATTNIDKRASYSNYGICLDLFAPGSSITSAWNSSDTATNTISGTSMATPHVTGVAALYLQAHPGSSPATVAAAITSNATPNVVGNPGRNSPNKLLYSLLP